MTPPIRGNAGIYDFGNFRIIDQDQDKRFDPKVDEVEGLSLPAARRRLQSLGISLKPGTSLGRTAYRANFEQAKRAAKSGDLAKTRKSLERAEVHLPKRKQDDFRLQKDFLLFGAAENFLKISESSRNKQLGEIESQDLHRVRAAGHHGQSGDASPESKVAGIVQRYHRLFAANELLRAESAAKSGDSNGAGRALLALLDVSFEANLPVDARRIQGIQADLENARRTAKSAAAPKEYRLIVDRPSF